MTRVRFTRTVQYESEGRGRGPIYEAGSEHEFEPAFAERWLRRKAAEIIETADPVEEQIPDADPDTDHAVDAGDRKSVV